MADLVLEYAGDAISGARDSIQPIFHLTASNERGRAMLRMLADPADPPAADPYGRKFIVLLEEQLDDIVRRAELAGLTVERSERQGSF